MARSSAMVSSTSEVMTGVTGPRPVCSLASVPVRRPRPPVPRRGPGRGPSPGATARRRRTGRPVPPSPRAMPSRRPRGGHEARVLAHRLVVVAADARHRLAARPRPRGSPAAVRTLSRAERVAAGAVLVVADHVGRVLVERAAGGDRHQLHAPAHAQGRAGRPRPAAVEQGDLPGVAVLAPAGGRGRAAPRRSAPGRRPRRRRPPARRGARPPSAPRSSEPEAGGSRTGTPPAATTASAYSRVQQVGALVPDAPGAPARGRWSARSSGPCRTGAHQSGVT